MFHFGTHGNAFQFSEKPQFHLLLLCTCDGVPDKNLSSRTGIRVRLVLGTQARRGTEQLMDLFDKCSDGIVKV